MVVYFVVLDISLVRAPALSVHMASDVRRQVLARQLLDIMFFGMGLLPMFGAEVPLFVASTFPVFVTRYMQAEITFYITVQIIQLKTFPSADLVSSAMLVWTGIKRYIL